MVGGSNGEKPESNNRWMISFEVLSETLGYHLLLQQERFKTVLVNQVFRSAADRSAKKTV